MGCGGSKLQEEAAVSLCRQRSQLLAEAIRYRYDLADAHAAYARSLQSVAVALHEFLYGTRPPPQASPVLPLPAQRKGDPVPPFTPSPLPAAAAAAAVSLPFAAVHGHSQSHSGSHINFHPSDSDSDDISPFHSDGGSPLHHLPVDDSAAVGKTYVNLNYAKKGPTQSSVTHEQQPPNSEPVRFGSVDEPASVAGPYYGYPYPPQNSNFYPSYPSYQSHMNYGDGMSGGFFGFSSPPPSIPPPAMAASGNPTSREPPPPPTSTASAFDFLNPFESFDNYFAPYSPRRSSRELREEEGIPDLEEEDREVVKEAYGDPKYTASTSASANGANATYSGKTARRSKEVEISRADDASQRKAKPVEAGSSSEHEIHMIEKSVVAEPAERRTAGFTVSRNYRNDSEIVQEIKTQFDRVSQSVEQASKMLEVGKTLYQKKNSSHKVSVRRMICGLSLTSTNADLSYEEDDSLSSTLQKLYSWEQKLLAEVMVEEEMRVQYERKRQDLRYLSERGAEAEKLEAVETSIRKLSTKIRISIQVAGTISNKINQLRDGELWLRVCEIINGCNVFLLSQQPCSFEEMWRVMSECHLIQHQAISQAQNLDSAVPGGKPPDALETIKHLELVMAEWIANFSIWVTAQKMYVNALNGWLRKGIAYEPEVTDDGEVPFSPGRLGAPPVFVICNYWSSSIDMVSEMEVIKAARSFIDNVLNIWKEHKAVQQQRQLTNKDKNSKLRSIEMEEQELLKQRKKLLTISSENKMPTIGHEDRGPTVISFQSSLRHVFEVVENFSANTMKLYEVLNKQTEEEKQRLVGEDARGS
ncbi:hypothetical protein ZIOFF_037705 [Zingiber officinale]|uniref:BZIP transcription factor n=1 Tax=Zingiber officinale TaxID=94328 RepID=A0A8J5GKF5_ZINOF|nr:hypothetical protein ZIOFF_037705 [Zingiber officinale]